jgi:uncharacterized membrane protein (DUF4010 family)
MSAIVRNDGRGPKDSARSKSSEVNSFGRPAQTSEWGPPAVNDASLPVLLGASFAVGLIIGVERGWRQRRSPSGSRVAGVRTYTLLGTGGGLAAILGALVHPAAAIVVTLALATGLVAGYWRDRAQKDATSFVAAVIALALGMLAGAGQPALAVAGAAVVTLLLATREQSHGFIARLNEKDVHAFARYAVIAGAVLPFLPNRSMGPLDAWNPFQLWLVVVLVTGFSFAGYIANRTVGARKGVLATAVIGGLYSSTAVTASLSQKLGRGEAGPFSAGILLASAMMYLRVIALVALLSPSTFPQFLLTVAPAAAFGLAIAVIAWRRAPRESESKPDVAANPIELLPAFGFVAIVAVAAVATRWAQGQFGEAGIATSLFITGSFDVDAAIVTLSNVPVEAFDRTMAAIALAGTIVANMGLKIFVTLAYARRDGRMAALGLAASGLVLLATIGWRLVAG